jgi:UDP-3-O-[3-hydroxymyristoyl] glucosamine N-acyltransferase
VRRALKTIAFALAAAMASPLIALARLEALLFGEETERIFDSCKECLALIPTPVGEYLRQAFYWGACRSVHPFTRLTFGAIIAHRNTVIAEGVVIGSFSIIGCVTIGRDVLIAPKVSILSGKYQHGRPQDREDHRRSEVTLEMITIGAGSFLGQGALILADVGTGATVGAGSVVNRAVPDGATVMGNPARKVSLDGPA